MSKYLVVLIGLVFSVIQVKSADEVLNRITHICTDKINVTEQCLVVGDPNVKDDKVLLDKTFSKHWLPFMTRTDDLVLPDGGWSSNNEITFVQVSNPGDSGTVRMTRGGPGFRTVGLHLESPRGQGYEFQVLIKGISLKPASNFSPLNLEAANSTPAALAVAAVAVTDSTQL